MTHSIFDPTGGEAERSGNRFTPPGADQISQLPQECVNPPRAQVSGTVDFQPPAQSPRIGISMEQDGKLLVVTLTGQLHKLDYPHFVPIFEAAVKKHGKVRILVEMHHFHGWDASAVWEDVKFDIKHFNDIERLAIVGEAVWESWMAAFCKPFTTAHIRYFEPDHAAEARTWITAA